ncbi:MAG: PspA-associated protein PspAA [Streptosporangiaceae bacterium]
MIVRIMGEGQFKLDDAELDDLNALDDALQRAVETEDEKTFRSVLSALLDRVRETGKPLPMDSLEPSDLLLPPADASVEDVREMLGDEGLIPG